jgi:hypothetical protein
VLLNITKVFKTLKARLNIYKLKFYTTRIIFKQNILILVSYKQKGRWNDHDNFI